MRNRFVPQQLVGILDQEARGIEYDQDFGKQSLDVGFAGFARDQLRYFGFSLVQQVLKFAEDCDSLPHS